MYHAVPWCTVRYLDVSWGILLHHKDKIMLCWTTEQISYHKLKTNISVHTEELRAQINLINKHIYWDHMIMLLSKQTNIISCGYTNIFQSIYLQRCCNCALVNATQLLSRYYTESETMLWTMAFIPFSYFSATIFRKLIWYKSLKCGELVGDLISLQVRH